MGGRDVGLVLRGKEKGLRFYELWDDIIWVRPSERLCAHMHARVCTPLIARVCRQTKGLSEERGSTKPQDTSISTAAARHQRLAFLAPNNTVRRRVVAAYLRGVCDKGKSCQGDSFIRRKSRQLARRSHSPDAGMKLERT